MRILPKLNLRCNTNQGLKGGFPTKSLLTLQESTRVSPLLPSPKGKGGDSYVEKPFYSKYSKKHDGKCLVWTVNFYGCGKSGHMKRDFPMMKTRGRENSHTQASSPNSNAPKKNHFYSLQYRVDQESSPNVVTRMLQLFSFDVYPLLDRGASLSFVTPFAAMKF